MPLAPFDIGTVNVHTFVPNIQFSNARVLRQSIGDTSAPATDVKDVPARSKQPQSAEFFQEPVADLIEIRSPDERPQ